MLFFTSSYLKSDLLRHSSKWNISNNSSDFVCILNCSILIEMQVKDQEKNHPFKQEII